MTSTVWAPATHRNLEHKLFKEILQNSFEAEVSERLGLKNLSHMKSGL